MVRGGLAAAAARVARSRYWRERDAAVVLAAWGASGESLGAFARSLGVNAKRLRRWRRALAGREGAVFHPVQVVEAVGLGFGATEAADGAALELVLRGGRRVLVRPGFDEATLARLVRVAEGAGC